MGSTQNLAENHLLSAINTLTSAFQEYAVKTDNKIAGIVNHLQEQTVKTPVKSYNEKPTKHGKFVSSLSLQNKYESSHISAQISQARRQLRNKREQIRKIKKRIVELDSNLRIKMEEEVNIKEYLDLLKERDIEEESEEEIDLK